MKQAMASHGLNARREGFALAAAVLAMMVVGAIVTGGFYAASQSGQIAKSTDAGDLALYVAETGLTAALGVATANSLNAIALDNTAEAGPTNVSYGGTQVGNYRIFTTRISQMLFVVRAEGTVTLGGPYAGATRTVATVIRIRNVNFNNGTAIQVYGNLTVGGNTDIEGADWSASQWNGCTTQTDTNAVTANLGSTVQTSGNGAINGDTEYEAMDSADFNVFGDLGFDEIASMANYVFNTTQTIGPYPQYLSGACRTAVTTQDNWGAPLAPTDSCFSWFPIIHAKQSLRIAANGTGQGILLVEGDLEISGGFTFYGVVVVRGTIAMTGTGGHVNGTLISYGNGSLTTTSTTFGNSEVQFSSCAITRAADGNSRLNRGIPIANRSYIDISNVQN